MCVYRWYPNQKQFFERFKLPANIQKLDIIPKGLEKGKLLIFFFPALKRIRNFIRQLFHKIWGNRIPDLSRLIIPASKKVKVIRKRLDSCGLSHRQSPHLSWMCKSSGADVEHPSGDCRRNGSIVQSSIGAGVTAFHLQFRRQIPKPLAGANGGDTGCLLRPHCICDMVIQAIRSLSQVRLIAVEGLPVIGHPVIALPLVYHRKVGDGVPTGQGRFLFLRKNRRAHF